MTKPTRHNLARKTFANGLRVLVEQFNVSHGKLAAETGITQSKISRYIRGRNEPKLADLAALCVYFNVSPEFFLDSTMPAAPLTPARVAAQCLFGPVEEKAMRDLFNTLQN